MAKSKFPLPLTILALAVCLLVFNLQWPSWVGSQLPPGSIAQIHFATPPESAPAYARREESRSRCPCYNSPQTLTALIPASNLALTTASHPTFFLYVPHAAGNAKTGGRPPAREKFDVEFQLADQQEHEIYQTIFAIAGTPGIVSFTLPPAAPALEPNKYYHWYFEVICDREDRSGDSVVSGWSRRVEPNSRVLQALKQASPFQQPGIYAEAGLWHDTIATLAELRRPKPNDSLLTTAWVELLQSVGLDKIAQEPLVNCCTQDDLKKAPDHPLTSIEKEPTIDYGC